MAPPGGGRRGPPRRDNGPVVTANGPAGRCVGYTGETAGPFPADGSNTARGALSNVLSESDVIRSDIRSDLGDPRTVAPGVMLDLTFTLVDVNNECAPLAGRALYLWHCSADGQYSLYDAPERSWLRGMQISDANGQVHFRTVFPGCYQGRYPHFHFELFSDRQSATSGQYARLVSQLALPPEPCAAVYRRADYGSSQANFARNNDPATDGIFRDNGEERLAAMTIATTGNAASGYRGQAVIGLVS